ncbi:MAG: TusE/DsrC/DsvC family sulfur relay protein [Gammaproteobacteria bacterium]|nr:TusE/DsrC/DsvC family sulfur relay protein [Gammaproteobacteria bacterium]
MADILGAEVDEEGFLIDLKDWTKEIAVEMAKVDDIDLGDESADLYQERWDVLNLLRDYFEEYQIAPAVRVLTKAVGKKLGKDKGSSKYLYTLFPYGPGKQGCKFAGLPKPTGCI